MYKLVWPARRASGTAVFGGNVGNSHVFNHQVKCTVATLLQRVKVACSSRTSVMRGPRGGTPAIEAIFTGDKYWTSQNHMCHFFFREKCHTWSHHNTGNFT